MKQKSKLQIFSTSFVDKHIYPSYQISGLMNSLSDGESYLGKYKHYFEWLWWAVSDVLAENNLTWDDWDNYIMFLELYYSSNKDDEEHLITLIRKLM